MRADLIRRIADAFRREISDVVVKAFGSSATNLYLPTGDIDLVVLSGGFESTRYPEISTSRNQLNKMVRNILVGGGLARHAQVIPSAKVPIIKFRDIKTGLPVDVSFENDSGLGAITTLNNWLVDYPALSRTVFLIKQFLKMRGLNDNATGGLGGFSTICLVVFRIHQMTGSYGASFLRDNLDIVLMDFFNFYGTAFDFRTTGLNMRDMSYIKKVCLASHQCHIRRLTLC